MSNELKLIVDLQAFDRVLDDLGEKLSAVPAFVNEKKAQIQQVKDALEQERKTLVTLQVDKKNKELEVSAQEEKIRKNEKELNSVKSNEAYKALLTEIEAAKQAKTDIEDGILAIMMDMDQASAHIKELEAKAKSDQSKIEVEIRQKEEEGARIKAEFDAETVKREAFAKQIPQDVVFRYDAIRKKQGMAMAAIRGDQCSGCDTTLTQSLINEVRKSKEMMTCENCSRILYIEVVLGQV